MGASPFTFFLSNTPTQVTYGNLGRSVTLAAGSTTEMSVQAMAGAEDIIWVFGNGPGASNAPVFDTDIRVREQIPEPVAASLMSIALGAFALVSLRKRRTDLHGR